MQTAAAIPASNPLADPAAGVSMRTDILVAIALALAAGVLYAGFGLRLAQGIYPDFFNLAFDVDPPTYVSLMTQEVFARGGVKHPLVLMLRPLAQPLLAAGFSANAASCLVMAGFGGATVGVVFLFLRRIAAALPEAILLTALFAVSGSQFFSAMIPESYGPAAFSIACVWLVAVWRLADTGNARVLRYAVAVLAYGVTTTNVLQSLLAEALVWLRHRGFSGAIRPLLVFGATLAVVLAVATALVWHDLLLQFLTDPLAVLKNAYWQRTKGARIGVADTVLRLLGYSVVSPSFSIVQIEGGIRMWDFRAPAFPPLAAVAALLWHLFWLAGAVAAFINPRTRWLAAGLAAMLLFNLVFHIDFQFRGSVYLYSPHTHFLLFALGAGLAPLLRPGSMVRRLYLAVALGLVVLVGSVTFDRAALLATSFDELAPHCDAPCRE